MVLNANLLLYCSFCNSNSVKETSIKCITEISWNQPYGAIDGTDAKAEWEDQQLFQEDCPTKKSWDLTELTQQWVDGSAANNGVILLADNEDVDAKDLRFNSSEADIRAYRPTLEIVWSQSLKTVYFLSRSDPVGERPFRQYSSHGG